MTRTLEEAINRLRKLPEEEHDAAAAAVFAYIPTTTLPHSRAQRPPHRPLNSIPSPHLLDHYVGGGQQCFRDREAERLCGLHVDDELEFDRLYDG
jgi:hypothetical protein